MLCISPSYRWTGYKQQHDHYNMTRNFTGTKFGIYTQKIEKYVLME